MNLFAHTIANCLENVIASKCKNQLKYFYTINGKLKISYDSHSGEVSAVITHNGDLLEIFGSEMMS